MSRRRFLWDAAVIGSIGAAVSKLWGTDAVRVPPLKTFRYGDVILNSSLHNQQFENCRDVLMGLDEDSLMKPFRQMAGQPAPGEDLGGWYIYDPHYDYRKDDAGLAPAATFGQWVSALSRMYAATGDVRIRERVLRLNQVFAKSISGNYFKKTRFPAYSYDKLVCGLIDAHEYAGDQDAFAILDATTKLALGHLPKTAVPREQSWRPGKDISYNWDESYTLPENLLLAGQRGAGKQYLDLAVRYLDDSYFDPLAANRNVFAGKHAYSYVNALSSAMLAAEVLHEDKYRAAAANGFRMLQEQSFATGGWGPDEQLRAPGSDDLATSLDKTHSSFETPCGAYAHFKLTRYLLAATRDSRYGDSMEQVMYNTVLGAKPLKSDGEAFYYSDYNFSGSKKYSTHRWPCCSGTLPQVAADYRRLIYFRDPIAGTSVYVNLYVPSTLRWQIAGIDAVLRQDGSYPFGGDVRLGLELRRPQEFTLLLRIPAWSTEGRVSLNGEKIATTWTPGAFLPISRTWKNGDRLTLDFQIENRLEAVDKGHPEIVALVRGPLSLFAIGDSIPEVTRKQLLAAHRSGEQSWTVDSRRGPLLMLPFTAIEEQPYSLYVRTAG